MSKAMLVTAPFVLLLLDYWPLNRIHADSRVGRDLARMVREKLPLFALSGAATVLTLLAQGGGSALQAGASLELTARLANAVVAVDHYLRRAFWPSQLALFYPHPGTWHPVTLLMACVTPALAAVAAFGSAQRFPAVFVGLAIFAGTLVPVLGLVQVGA